MSQPITLDDIFALFRESEQERKEFQRTSQQAFEQSQRAFEQSQQAFEQSQRAFEERQQAFEQYRQTAEREMAKLRETVEETSKQIAQTNKQVAQTNKQVGGLTSRWGEFVENLIKPAAARLFQEKGIEVHLTAQRVTGQDDKGSIEIDVLVENTTEVVAIEVKSHLEVRDVKRFLETLERFKKAFPKRKNDRLYGAVAGIKIDERVNEYAIQEGLFLIQPAGDSAIIANSPDFQPRVW
ncbi:DUF3782 domain-containing protein [Pseudanabaena sp. FACHB-1277]|uniref:DUF3782 domain-containing protein n=1 Tax=Pseudanabaena cinerea FACHB-1277 TaxID=2949581 RepID=A0A926UTJ0_9CYAN|nr:DUF3782 domain-containing protein [Pseudanabaena cinerea]MBD2151031.1 DUF3782 domain-containing protein [Pseudanabaena cinerea FACHB-1277]